MSLSVNGEKTTQSKRGIEPESSGKLEIAREAARRAGDVLIRRLGKVEELDYKGRTDLVSDVDRKSEETILRFLRNAAPEIPVTTEERSSTHRRTPERWIVDPLDGTTNYVHSCPVFAVSIAHEKNGAVDAGVVFNPYHEEEYIACKGGGAFLNGVPIRVSIVAKMKHALAATGFPYEIENMIDFITLSMREMLLRVQGLRRAGSAALDLCFVAAGRYDFFWEMKLAPWDVAAGSIILQEAGGTLSSPFGEPFDVESGNVLGSNGLIHDDVIEVLKQIGRKAGIV